MPEPERSIEELVDVFEVTTVTAALFGNSGAGGADHAKDKARNTLLRAVARLREENERLRGWLECAPTYVTTGLYDIATLSHRALHSAASARSESERAATSPPSPRREGAVSDWPLHPLEPRGCPTPGACSCVGATEAQNAAREEGRREAFEECAPALERLKVLVRALDRGGEAAWAAEAHAIYCELSNALAARKEGET